MDKPISAIPDETTDNTAISSQDGLNPHADMPNPIERPADVPEAFWDAERGQIRVDDLLKAHIGLLAGMDTPKAEQTSPEDARGPADDGEQQSAADPIEPFAISSPHPLLASDEAVNVRLREAGLNGTQTQLVYDLAAEVLVPLIETIAWESKAAQHVARLSQDFGGAEAWSRTAHELRTWGKANLAPDVYATLASDPEGIHAMHQMMASREPRLIGQADARVAELDEAALNDMVKDPRYWRDRDRDFVAQVTAGFQKLYRR